LRVLESNILQCNKFLSIENNEMSLEAEPKQENNSIIKKSLEMTVMI
jgi:hypothetical protein